MGINKTQLNKLRARIESNYEYLEKNNYVGDSNKKHSVALSMSALMEYYGLNQYYALDSITDGDGDNKIDAFYFSTDEEELNELVIIQSKFKQEYGSKNTFSKDEIELTINSAKKVINGEDLEDPNERLISKIEEYRKLLKENGNPSINIRLFFVTNGVIHKGRKTEDIVITTKSEGITCVFLDATEFDLVPEKKDGTLKINAKDNSDKTDSIFKNQNFEGKLVSCTIENLMKFYKETGERQLLDENVRYRIKNSRVNKDIEMSFRNNPENFCFLNNGITLVCESFSINKTGSTLNNLELKKPSIVNGGQTISTLYDIYSVKDEQLFDSFSNAHIFLRIYKIPEENILEIAKATNSQNPINIVDLNANDENQKIVKKYFEKKGIGFLTKVGEEVLHYDDTITNENALQLYAAFYGDEPSFAKRSKRSVFNKYYPLIINDKTNDETCKHLYRCFLIYQLILGNEKIDKQRKSNAIFSILYTLKLFEPNLLNINIPDTQIETKFNERIEDVMILINIIIHSRSDELKEKFSMNNLFKSYEIKSLIDVKFNEMIVENSKK